jgi:hypothetical protein
LKQIKARNTEIKFDAENVKLCRINSCLISWCSNSWSTQTNTTS